MYRDYYHSFWNDDLSEKGMEGYRRRIVRIQSLSAKKETILFVRAAASTEELLHAGELLDLLLEKYGPLAHLLLIVDFQRNAPGACVFEGMQNLMVYLLEGEVHAADDGKPYAKPIQTALCWAAGQDIEARTFPDLQAVTKVADPTDSGLVALGGLRSFEESIDGSVPTPDVEQQSVWGASISEPLGDSTVLEDACRSFVTPIYDDGVYLVSIGCSTGPKMSLQVMGRGFLPLPFDWIRTSLDGVLHFLNSDFADFFEFNTSHQVPGQDCTMYRSKYHSFWHDDPTNSDVQARYKDRMNNLKGLNGHEIPILFVRSVACNDEIKSVDLLLKALHTLFGENACLLLIVDFQKSATGALSVENMDDLLVYFLDGSVHAGETASAPYRAAISAAIDWVKGEEIDTQTVETLEALHELSDATKWGMCGVGELNSFEFEEM